MTRLVPESELASSDPLVASDNVPRPGLARDAELTRFLFVDNNGIVRGKSVTKAHLGGRMDSGIGLAQCRQAANVLDVVQPQPGLDAVGEVRLQPDPSTLIALPHAPGSSAFLCDLVDTSGHPWPLCPRDFLKRAIRAANLLGFDIMAAFEPEFTLCRTKPREGAIDLFDDALCFDATGFDAAHPIILEVVRALIGQNIDVEIYHPEFGPGQHEITIRHAPALKAADLHVWQRVLTRGVVSSLGAWATFAPIPSSGMRGNGNHLHISFWRSGQNAFADPSDPLGLSETAYHFIGGVLNHRDALVALTCASVNSYRRLRPGMWSGAFACYGPDNREAMIRIPSMLKGAEAASTNIELKACDCTANPYLALGALIFAGLDGIAAKKDPGAAMTLDPRRLGATELQKREIGLLPSTLEEAIAALERDAMFVEAVGGRLLDAYCAIKRSEIEFFKEREQEEFQCYSRTY